MKHRKGYWIAAFVLVLLLSLSFARAQEIDLMQYAKDCLTEVYGYTAEEAEDFVFETRADGSLAFWPREHPAWVYTVYREENGRLNGTSPFYTGFMMYCGDNAVQDLLRMIREKGWFVSWNEESRDALIAACKQNFVRVNTDLLFAESAAHAAQALLESCFGPEARWTDALRELRDDVFTEYGLTREETPFHVPGVRAVTNDQIVLSWPVTYTLFDGGVYPEELLDVFSDPHLAGWTCQSGALLCNVQTKDGSGLAAFEKDGRRQLVQLDAAEGVWTISPLGENALYPTGDYRVTYNVQRQHYAVEYLLSDDETAVFYVTPVNGRKNLTGETYCQIEYFERINRATGEALGIGGYSGNTWIEEETVFRVGFPLYLGVVPITDFPTTAEAAREYVYPGVPEGYVYCAGVNLREKTSSRSKTYGMLNRGVLLPVLDILPGDPSEWVHTRVGFLEGYVVIVYTNLGEPQSLPVAAAQRDIPLKSGAGLLDRTIQTLPAGTRMHVVIDNGDWLYVDVPQGEIGFLMDVDGTFGYVKKNDVVISSALPQLKWADEETETGMLQ